MCAESDEDVCFQGRQQGIVFQTHPSTAENMMQRIQNAITSISRTEIETALSSTFNPRIENDEMHFEPL